MIAEDIRAPDGTHLKIEGNYDMAPYIFQQVPATLVFIFFWNKSYSLPLQSTLFLRLISKDCIHTQLILIIKVLAEMSRP